MEPPLMVWVHKMPRHKLFETIIKSILYEEESLIGGKADNETVSDIATLHNVSVSSLERQIEIGVSEEGEHTSSEAAALEIVLDHLHERPDYYDRLEDMEKLPVEKIQE